MKKWLLIIAMISFLVDGDILTKDTLDPGRTNIKSKTGENKGWLKKDTLEPDRVNIYDKNGNLKGYLKKDSLNPDNWQFKGRTNESVK
ncbi:MAG: hypothetical protein ABIN18_02550 [Pseudomonadota bacterium]